MPGLIINIDTSEAQRATARLEKNLDALGATSKLSVSEITRFEDRMKAGMGADKARKALEEVTRAAGLSATELAKLQKQIGDVGGAFNTLSGDLSRTVSGFANLKNAIIGTGLGLFAKDVVEVGAAFEKTMAGVGGMMSDVNMAVDGGGASFARLTEAT